MNILQDWNARKAAKLVEKFAADEQSLVPVDQPRGANTQGGNEVDPAKKRSRRVHMHGEATSHGAASLKTCFGCGKGARLQAAVGVQEKQHVAGRSPGAVIHLESSATL